MTRCLRVLALAVVVVLTSSACNPFAGDEEEPPPPPPTTPPTEPPSPVGASIDGTLRIGAVLPLSGELAEFGPGLRSAVELAVDDINDAGGVEGDVELLVEDSQSTAEGALAAATTLIEEQQVDALVGPAASVVLHGGMLDAALEAERVVCSPTASAPRLSDIDTKDLFFSTTANLDGQVELLAAEIEALPDGRDGRIAVVRRAEDPDAEDLFQDLQVELEDAFGEAGAFEIVADVQLPGVPLEDDGPDEEAEATPDTAPPATTEPNDPSPTEGEGEPDVYVAAVDEVLDARADAVVVMSHPGESVLLFRAMFDADILPVTSDETEVPVLVTATLASDRLADAIDPTRPAILEDVVGVRPEPDPEGPEAFVERLKAEQAVADVDFAARAFECVNLVALGALVAGSDDPNQIKTEIVPLTGGGEACGSFGACVAPVLDGDDVDYEGVLGLDLNAEGEVREGPFQVFRFDAQGDLDVLRTNTVVNPETDGASESADDEEPVRADP